MFLNDYVGWFIRVFFPNYHYKGEVIDTETEAQGSLPS